MLTYEIKNLPVIFIIGKEGMCEPSHNVVSELWAEATNHFDEVAPLAKKNENGAFCGFWGAMSDRSRLFLPWENDFSTGLYLAGPEVGKDAEAPEGWTKWCLPARKYMVVSVTMDRYAEIFTEVLQHTIPDNNLRLCGAVCDFTDPQTNQNYLYFPVEEA